MSERLQSKGEACLEPRLLLWRHFGESKCELLPPTALFHQSFLLDLILPKTLQGLTLFRFPEAQRGKQTPLGPLPTSIIYVAGEGLPFLFPGEGTLLGNLGFTESAPSNPDSPVSPEPSGDGGSPPASSWQPESGTHLPFPCRHRPPLPSRHEASGRRSGRHLYRPVPFLTMSARTTASDPEPW